MASPRWRCLNLGNLWICTLHAKRDLQMWLRLRTLRWTIYPGYSRWAWSNHTVLKSGRERQKTVAKKCDTRRTTPAFIGFEGGWEWASAKSQQRNWGPWSYNHKELNPANSINKQKTFFPRAPEKQPPETLIFLWWDLYWTHDPENHPI